MLSFPSSAHSVDGWLDAINMPRYKPTLAAAGISTVDKLHDLTDEQLQAAGVSLLGHRKRMLQAAKELCHTDAMETEPAFPLGRQANGEPPRAPPADATHVSPAAAEAQQQRFNSTSSIFITSTISKPDIDEIIFCVAVVIHDRVVQGEELDHEARSRYPFFSEDNNPLYAEPAPRSSGEREHSSDSTAMKRMRREVPTEETIYCTVRSIYDCARLPSECLIVSLVYIERLIKQSQVPILITSWRPILLAALILAQKVWDDRALHNIYFAFFCPMFTLKEINHLEEKFLQLIDFNVYISSSLYASYYFQLRTLCHRENRTPPPTPFLPCLELTAPRASRRRLPARANDY